MVEAAPVNLGELGWVEVEFFAGTGLPVPVEIGADAWLARVDGQALTVMVTTDSEEITAAGFEVWEAGVVEFT